MWPTTTSRVGYGIPPEMGMFVVAPQYHQSTNYMTSEGNNAATALGVGVIPLLGTIASDYDHHDLIARNRAGAAQWQHHQMGLGGDGFSSPSAPNKKSINFDTGGVTPTCQDCGNQSKKDCSHQRCRTCCRSRGFDCSTHVKSTWVPAARRRERQSMTSATGTGGGGGASSGSTSGAKKPRIKSSQTTSNNSTSNTPPRSFDATSSHQDASFKETLPGQVRAAAVFKCVKVTAVEEGDDEFAYQAIVKIGGHVFKGFLYDQGVQTKHDFPNMSELHLSGGVGGGGGGGGGGGRNSAFTSTPHIHHSDVYVASGAGGGLIGGSTYGPNNYTFPRR